MSNNRKFEVNDYKISQCGSNKNSVVQSQRELHNNLSSFISNNENKQGKLYEYQLENVKYYGDKGEIITTYIHNSNNEVNTNNINHTSNTSNLNSSNIIKQNNDLNISSNINLNNSNIQNDNSTNNQTNVNNDLNKSSTQNNDNINNINNNKEKRKYSPFRGGIINLDFQSNNNNKYNIKNIEKTKSQLDTSELEKKNTIENIKSEKPIVLQPSFCSVTPSYNEQSITIEKSNNKNKLKSVGKTNNIIHSSNNNEFIFKIHQIDFTLTSKVKKFNPNLSIYNDCISILNKNKKKKEYKVIMSTSLFIDKSQALQGSRVYLTGIKPIRTNWNNLYNIGIQNTISLSILNSSVINNTFNSKLKSNNKNNHNKEIRKKSYEDFITQSNISENKYIFINNSNGNYISKNAEIYSIKDLKDKFQNFLNSLGKNTSKNPYIIPQTELIKIMKENCDLNEIYLDKDEIEIIQEEKENEDKNLMTINSNNNYKQYHDFSQNTPSELLDDKFSLFSISKFIKYSFPSFQIKFTIFPNGYNIEENVILENENEQEYNNNNNDNNYNNNNSWNNIDNENDNDVKKHEDENFLNEHLLNLKESNIDDKIINNDIIEEFSKENNKLKENLEQENEKLINKNFKSQNEIEKIKRELLGIKDNNNKQNNLKKQGDKKLKSKKNNSQNRKKTPILNREKDLKIQNKPQKTINERNYIYKPDIKKKKDEWENRPYISQNINFNIYTNNLGVQKVNMNPEKDKQQK